MNINSDINVLGSLLDFNLIAVLLNKKSHLIDSNETSQSYTSIKTIKSYKRFVSSINNSLLKFSNQKIADLVQTVFKNEGLSPNCLLLLFWNASVNNELLDYLNRNGYFPALYRGRVSLKKDEAAACLKELKQTEQDLQKWSDSTINTTASKYLTLLKKFNLIKGGLEKTITTPYVGDKEIVLFVYWLLTVEDKPNLLENSWLQYGFLEKEAFTQQIMQKKFMKYFNLQYSGNNLKIELILSYKELYSEL